MDDSQIPVDVSQALDALSRRLHAHTVPIIVWPRRPDERVSGDRLQSYLEKTQACSGVLIEFGRRLFVVTCGHGLPETFSPERVTFAPGDFVNQAKFIVNWWRIQWPDIGIVELRHDAFEVLPNKLALTVDDLFLEAPPPTGLVCGYPNRLVERRPVGYGATRDYWLVGTAQVLPVEICSVDQWPRVLSGDPTTAESIDLFMPYNKDVMVDSAFQGRTTNAPYGDPTGLSGGGIWVTPPRMGNTVFHVDPKLVGIQSRADKNRYLRGCRISAALELLVANFPELEQIIRQSDSRPSNSPLKMTK